MLRILVLALMLGLWSGSAWAAPLGFPVGGFGSPVGGGDHAGGTGGDYETGGNEGEGGDETDGAGDNVIRKQYTVQDATNAALDQGNTVSVTYK